MSEESQQPAVDKKPRVTLINVVRWAIAVVVVVTLVYVVGNATTQLSESDFSFKQVGYGWWALSVGVYVVTMILSASFWHRVLVALGQRPSFSKSLLAYFVSQLGKYVPGKAMVVVVRTDIIRGEKVNAAPAAASVFVETLTWIFVGSAISSFLFAVMFRDQTMLGILAIVFTLVAGLLTWPPVFKKLAASISAVLKRGAGAEKSLDRFAGLNVATMGYGWIVMTFGWCLNGLSLWCVLKGMPGTDVAISDFPLTLICVALATVAGFVSLLPGGLGVRELVIIPLLGTRFGPVTAIVAAIVIRLVWLGAEVVASAIIYGVLKKRN
ncbi:MAG: lysylphosphatidylglycerol synthase transmembrane domain-containing protein [Planctomycetota bacterium]